MTGEQEIYKLAGFIFEDMLLIYCVGFFKSFRGHPSGGYHELYLYIWLITALVECHFMYY